MREPGQDPVAVELQEPHERRRRCRRAQREPYPVSHLELLSGLLEQSDGMVRRALREHDRVSGPEEGHGEQPFAYDHYQACENPIPGRLHPPGKDQGPDTCDPTGEAEGREEIARTPDSRERHRSLERVGYVVKGIGIDDQSLEHEGTEKDHQHPRMRQDKRERDQWFLHELLLWFRRYNDFSELRRTRESTTGATPFSARFLPPDLLFGRAGSILVPCPYRCIISRCLLCSLVLHTAKVLLNRLQRHRPEGRFGWFIRVHSGFAGSLVHSLVRCDRRRFYPQESGCPGEQPPGLPAAHRDKGRHQEDAEYRGVYEDAGAEARRHDLDVRLRDARKCDEGQK